MGQGRRQTRTALFFGVGALATAIALGAYAGHALRSLELKSVDTRFSIRGTTGTPADVAVVGIDEASFDALRAHHLFNQWPWPRRYHARVINRIAAAHPKAIAIDIQFTEQTTGRDDNALIESVANAHHVVLAATATDGKGHTDVFGGESVLRQIGAVAGNASIATDPDGVIRRVPYSLDGLTWFGIAAAAISRG